ncbi:ATP-binding protein [Candidatus Micrarchaeota archaeon]|nr:ATP-binding protein [Candidatus Micrarchaeota archaeon]
MGKLHLSKISNVELAKRNFLVHPPEPPMDILFSNPSDSIYVGRTKMLHVPFYWSYKPVANPHIAVVGITGSGKSYFIKTFLTRASFVWNTNALIIDWAGEYKDWVKQTGGKIISLGKGSYLNLLDLGGMKPYNRIKQVMRTLELLTDLGQYPEQKRLTELAIEKAYLKNKFKMDAVEQRDEIGKALMPPTLKDVVKLLEEQSKLGKYEFPAELENSIYRLKQFVKPGEDFFAQQSTVSLDEITTSGLIDLDLSGLPDEVTRALGALSILQFIKEKMRASGWAKEKGLRLIIVLDEAWKIAKEDNSDAVMIVREGRKYNFGLIVASQNPTDISETIFSNVGTTFILKVKFERYLDYLQGSLNFSNFMREEIGKFGVGEAAVNMAFHSAASYASTFLLDKIEGEEPLKELFLDLIEVLTEKQKRDINMPKSISFHKDDLRKKLREFGLGEERLEEVTKLFERKSRHLDVVFFVILLERYGIARNNIAAFLKDMNIDDSTIINIFTKADYRKEDLGDRDVTQVLLEED